MAERQQAALGDSPAAGRATRSTMHAPILIRRPRAAPNSQLASGFAFGIAARTPARTRGSGELYALRSNKLGPVVVRGKSGKLCRLGAIWYRFHIVQDVGHPSGLALGPSSIL
jgi:hypothetical protein